MSDPANRLPVRAVERLAWLQVRLGQWIDNAEALGLEAEELARLEDLFTQASDALWQARTARSLALSASAAFRSAAEPFSALTAATVARIRARAESTGNSELYTIARIDRARRRTLLPAPEIPREITTSILNNGAVELRWKHTSPSGRGGVSFDIERLIAAPCEQVGYTMIGSTNAKRFIDSTVAPGSAMIRYRLRARRAGRASGLSPTVLVYLGVPTGLAQRQAA